MMTCASLCSLVTTGSRRLITQVIKAPPPHTHTHTMLQLKHSVWLSGLYNQSHEDFCALPGAYLGYKTLGEFPTEPQILDLM